MVDGVDDPETDGVRPGLEVPPQLRSSKGGDGTEQKEKSKNSRAHEER